MLYSWDLFWHMQGIMAPESRTWDFSCVIESGDKFQSERHWLRFKSMTTKTTPLDCSYFLWSSTTRIALQVRYVPIRWILGHRTSCTISGLWFCNATPGDILPRVWFLWGIRSFTDLAVRRELYSTCRCLDKTTKRHWSGAERGIPDRV